MKCHVPLKRSAIKRRPRKAKPGDDPAYLAWVRTLPCLIGHECVGRVEAHHSTASRGLGQKTTDRETMPLCAAHHNQFHNARGVFSGWTREGRRTWQRRMLEGMRRLISKDGADE